MQLTIKDTFINKLFYSSYKDALKLLKEKYGVPTGNYFINLINFTTNPKIKRTKEGLFIHHDMENKFVMLSTKGYAEHYPEAHEAENLTYCNLLEHLILHLIIHREKINLYEQLGSDKYFEQVTLQKATPKGETEPIIGTPDVGIGGAVNYLIPDIEAWYSITPHPKFGNIGVPSGWREACYSVIKDYKEDYLTIKELSKKDIQKSIR